MDIGQMIPPAEDVRVRNGGAGGRRRGRLVALAVVALIAVPVVGAAATVINTDRYVLTLGQTATEDVYVAASTGRVDGTVEGDLVITTGDLVVAGTVTGDLLVVSHGRVTVSGTVEGSVRGVARSMLVSGRVGDDLVVATLALTSPGAVGRDLLVVGATVDIAGEVGRDVLGRGYDVDIAGNVGRDVHMTVRSLRLSADATVGGDTVYKSRRSADIPEGAAIGGQVIPLPSRASFFVAVVLRLAFLLGFFGYVVGGIVLLWLFPRLTDGAVRLAGDDALRTLGVGAAVVVGAPLLLAVLAFTLVGIPLAVGLLIMIVLGLVFGTVPVVAAAGMRLVGGRGGVYGGFVAGAAVWWAAMSILPALGAAIFLVALVWGVGAWLLSGWRRRMEPLAGSPVSG